MTDTAKRAVMASFAADALALGAHWIYDPEKIRSRFGRVTAPAAPGPDSFHAGKEKGDFTHYGDQMLTLLESVAERNDFDLSDFADRWRKLFDGYKGYFDSATKSALKHLANGGSPEQIGSRSDDLSGASRVAPLVYRFRSDEKRLSETARAQAKMTHGDPGVVDAAEFFARVAFRVLNGAKPTAAIESTVQDHFAVTSITAWVQRGMAAKDKDPVAAVGEFGRSCHIGEMFPGVIQIIARYESDLKEALIQCVMAGGDSAARGSLTGLVLGAHSGAGEMPGEWVSEMKAAERIEVLLGKITA